MQRFNDEKGKNGKAQIQHQRSMVAFFDTINFLCAKILGNIRRNRIADGDKNQREHILYSHCRRITKEVFQTYRRTKWNIEDSTERFFKHETQMSSLIGGENDGYERFHEFIDYDNTPENQAIEEMVFQSLHNVLELLPPKDYELIYELYFKNHTERECAQRLGMSQQAIHERKKRILKKIKNNLDEEGC